MSDTSGLDLAGTVTSMAGAGEDARGPQPVPVAVGERYVVARPLGEGGMGIVYEAEDRQFGRRVALKKMRRSSDVARQQRFVAEAIVTANLEHPGIASVYERGVDEDGAPFYAMRLVQGRTVREVVAECQTIEQRLALLPAVVRVAHTLAFAHERGVVHRDVKPENVVIGRHGETVLLDWGIAKVRGMPSLATADADAGDAKRRGTQHGAVMGTPAYMAPEQAAGEVDRIDERTDVFALGALLYHLLTGRPPFEAEPGTDILEKVKAVAVTPVRALAARAPDALCTIVERAMQRAPEQRYQTATELANALDGFIGNALSGDRSRAVRLMTSVAAVMSMALLGVSLVMVVSMMPTMREQGAGSWAYTFFMVVGLALTIAEWRTHARHQLALLALGLAGATLLTGIANAFTGFMMVLRGVERMLETGQAAQAHGVLVSGAYEAFGNVAPACAFAAAQLVALALVVRANRLQERSVVRGQRSARSR